MINISSGYFENRYNLNENILTLHCSSIVLCFKPMLMDKNRQKCYFTKIIEGKGQWHFLKLSHQFCENSSHDVIYQCTALHLFSQGLCSNNAPINGSCFDFLKYSSPKKA